MATEGGFPENFMSSPATRATGGKRKRGPTQSPAMSRASPMSRRNNNNNQYQNAGQDDPIGAPTATMESSVEALFQQNASHFNLPALQPNNGNNTTGGNHNNNIEDTANVNTAAAALNFSMHVPGYSTDSLPPNTGGEGDQTNFDLQVGNTTELDGDQTADQSRGDFPDSPGGNDKPAVGSDEWQRLRKDNHKEVERRRRETINEGINELAKIVPNCEKNKGSILARAVQYITQLREEASQNIDKWTFEKLVTEQAINDLSSKLQKAWAEKEAWKRIARENGVDVEHIDLGLGGDEKDDDDDDDDGDTHRAGRARDRGGDLTDDEGGQGDAA